MVYAILSITPSAIDVESANLFMDNILQWIVVASGFVVSVLYFMHQIKNILSTVFETIKGKAEAGDVQGLIEEFAKVESLVREIRALEDIRGLQALESDFVDEETKKSFASVLDEFHEAQDFTKEQWSMIQKYLRSKE